MHGADCVGYLGPLAELLTQRDLQLMFTSVKQTYGTEKLQFFQKYLRADMLPEKAVVVWEQLVEGFGDEVGNVAYALMVRAHGGDNTGYLSMLHQNEDGTCSRSHWYDCVLGVLARAGTKACKAFCEHMAINTHPGEWDRLHEPIPEPQAIPPRVVPVPDMELYRRAMLKATNDELQTETQNQKVAQTEALEAAGAAEGEGMELFVRLTMDGTTSQYEAAKKLVLDGFALGIEVPAHNIQVLSVQAGSVIVTAQVHTKVAAYQHTAAAAQGLVGHALGGAFEVLRVVTAPSLAALESDAKGRELEQGHHQVLDSKLAEAEALHMDAANAAEKVAVLNVIAEDRAKKLAEEEVTLKQRLLAPQVSDSHPTAI